MGTLLVQEAGGDHGDTISDSAPSWGAGRLWEVVIARMTSSVCGVPEVGLVGRRLCLEVNSSLERSSAPSSLILPRTGLFLELLSESCWA